MKKNLRRAVTLSILAAFCGGMLYAGSAEAGYTLTIEKDGEGISGVVTDENGNTVGGIDWLNSYTNRIYLVDADGNNITSDNTINFNSGIFDGIVRGGYSEGSDEVSGNKVIISGGTVGGVRGGSSDNGSANGNKVSISGGIVSNKVYGGFSNSGSANENKVEISGGIVNGMVGNNYVHGGYSYSGSASANEVKISGGNVVGDVYGGLSYSGSVRENKVSISGGVVGYVDGGYSEYGKVSGNVVSISGGTINGDVYGGCSFEGNVIDNTIELSGDANVSSADLYGGYRHDGGTVENNHLVINAGTGSVVNSVNNFSDITFKNIKWDGQKAVLDIVDQKQALKDTEIKLENIAFQGGSSFNVNDSMTFIKGNNLGLDDGKIDGKKNFTSGVAIMGTGKAKVDGGNLIYTITDKRTQPQVDLVAQSHAITAAFVNQGSELVADGIASLTQDTNYGTKTFAAVYGNRSKYDVNSDIKINGWSGIIGVGNEKKIAEGDFSWGVFFENGSGNYRTYNSFNGDFFRGDGSVVYNGGGVMARLEKDNGVYTEASLRAGMVKNENTNALKEASGASYGYKTENAYYGAHLGVGKVISLDREQELDVYGKFFHTYTGGDSFTAAGDKFELGSINSDRLQIGAKLTTNKNNKWSAFYGLAWEYEFNGDSDVTAAGMRVPEQSLQGSSFIGEIGLHFAADKKSPWSMDAKLRGYAGEREGFSGNVQVNYSF